jgi:predicted nucleic acid-binding Zn ribbon protein
MPIKEHSCKSPDCREYGKVVEHFFHTSDPEPSCPACGAGMALMISRFGVVFTGPISSRYNDRKLEYAHREGVWMTEKNTPDGKEKLTYVTDWSERKRIMKQEGLVDAGCADISSDGRKFSSQGMPGAWV